MAIKNRLLQEWAITKRAVRKARSYIHSWLDREKYEWLNKERISCRLNLLHMDGLNPDEETVLDEESVYGRKIRVIYEPVKKHVAREDDAEWFVSGSVVDTLADYMSEDFNAEPMSRYKGFTISVELVGHENFLGRVDYEVNDHGQFHAYRCWQNGRALREIYDSAASPVIKGAVCLIAHTIHRMEYNDSHPKDRMAQGAPNL